MDKVSHFIIFEKTGDMINVNLLDNHFTMTFFYFIIKNDIKYNENERLKYVLFFIS